MLKLPSIFNLLFLSALLLQLSCSSHVEEKHLAGAYVFHTNDNEGIVSTLDLFNNHTYLQKEKYKNKMIENNGTWSTDLPGKNEKHFIDTRQQFIVFHEYAGFSKQGDSIEFVRKGDYELYVRKDFGMIRLCEDNCESVESDSSGKTINNYFAKY